MRGGRAGAAAGACEPEADQTRTAATVHQAGVDGFVVYSVPEDAPHLAAVLQRPLPTVVCDQLRIDGVDHVGIDDHAAMAAVGRHLVDLGHRRIGVICMRLGRERHDGPVDVPRQRTACFHVQRARLAGLADAFGAVQVEWALVPVVERFQHTTASGASAAAELLDRSRLTALVCTSDVLALGALGAVRRRGLRVPEDVTVTGFDGVSEAERAGLTTVRQPVREKGRPATAHPRRAHPVAHRIPAHRAGDRHQLRACRAGRGPLSAASDVAPRRAARASS